MHSEEVFSSTYRKNSSTSVVRFSTDPRGRRHSTAGLGPRASIRPRAISIWEEKEYHLCEIYFDACERLSSGWHAEELCKRLEKGCVIFEEPLGNSMVQIQRSKVNELRKLSIFINYFNITLALDKYQKYDRIDHRALGDTIPP